MVARELVRRGYEVACAIDVDPSKVGRDLGEVVGLGERLGVRVTDDPEALARAKPYATIHATASYLDAVFEQLADIAGCGSHAVSTCETLAYPYYRYPYLARELDKRAREAGVVVIGTGVNPGFALDTLVFLMTTACLSVDRVVARRVVDASKRRAAFVRKIGVGLTPREFFEKLERGEITGHVGYAESVMLVASALGVELDAVLESQEPVVAESDVEVGGYSVPRGRVVGLRGEGVGYRAGEEFIRVEFSAYLGAEDREEVVIEGDPPMHWVNTIGVHGDRATVAVLLNVLSSLDRLKPGLRTMRDLVLVSWRAPRRS